MSLVRLATPVSFVVVAALVAMLLGSCTGGGGGAAAPSTTGPGSTQGGGTQGGGSTQGGSVAPVAASATADTPANQAAQDLDFFYTLSHPTSAPADVSIEYSSDGGGAWFPASAGQGGDGPTALSTSPAGERHRFVWAAAADVRATLQREMKLRVTPVAPAAGVPAASARFEVDGSALQAPVKLKRYPFVQRVVGDAAVVSWRTVQASRGHVEFGDTPALGRTAAPANANPASHFEVELTGLAPGSIVYYRVFGDGAPLGPGERFKAAADPSQAFRFAVFGDSGTASNGQKRIASQVGAFDPDFLLHTGDIIYPTGADSDYQPKFFDIYRDLARRSPFFLAMGNHDILNIPPGQPFVDNFIHPSNNRQGSEKYYSFEHGNARFIALDSSLSFIIPGSQQHLWLIDELQKPRPDWLFVFFHHPLYSTGTHGSDYVLRYMVQPLFEQAQVDVVFTGHEHSYERTKAIRDFAGSGRGVVHFVTGGGGVGLRSISGNASWSEKAESAHHFLGVEVAGRTMHVDVIRDDGTTIETVTMTK